MTNVEVVQELRQRVKPFLHTKPPVAQSSYSILLRNAELGLSKPVTLSKFFSKFGYEGSYDNWSLRTNYIIPSPVKV